MGCRELQVNDYFRMADSVSGTDVPYYALADANKNITEYIDASGTIQAHYEYSPFGKITQQSGTMASDFDYRFSSEYADDETGLVYYNYRYYSPELGRWLSRDPIEEIGGYNLYAMVGNDALNWIDLLGLSSPSRVNRVFAGEDGFAFSFLTFKFGWFNSKTEHSASFSLDWGIECDEENPTWTSSPTGGNTSRCNVNGVDFAYSFDNDGSDGELWVVAVAKVEWTTLGDKLARGARRGVATAATGAGLFGIEGAVVAGAGGFAYGYFTAKGEKAKMSVNVSIRCICKKYRTEEAWEPVVTENHTGWDSLSVSQNKYISAADDVMDVVGLITGLTGAAKGGGLLAGKALVK